MKRGYLKGDGRSKVRWQEDGKKTSLADKFAGVGLPEAAKYSMGASIPDVLIRVLEIIDGITCPILIVATVRMYNKEREQKKEE